MSQWLVEWLDTIKAHDGTRASTLHRYRELAKVYLEPCIGRKRLDRLVPADVQRMLADGGGRAGPATLRQAYAVLRAALADAERMELVTRNVARSVKAPAIARTERRAVTPGEIKKLLAETAGDSWLHTYILVAITTGLRRGEMLALRWSDVDLVGRTLHVRRGLQRTDGGLVFVEPKTTLSRRALILPRIAADELASHQVRQDQERSRLGQAWEDNDLIFASTIGTPAEPRNVNRRFAACRDRVGLTRLRPHDLRHACATLLIAQGVEPRVIMSILGHSTILLTMNTYAHVLPEVMRDAADAMDRALDDSSGEVLAT